MENAYNVSDADRTVHARETGLNGDDQDRRRLFSPFAGLLPRICGGPSRHRRTSTLTHLRVAADPLEFMVCGQWVFFFGIASTPPSNGSILYRCSSRSSRIHSRVARLRSQVPHLPTDEGRIRKITPHIDMMCFMCPLNSATIQVSKAAVAVGYPAKRLGRCLQRSYEARSFAVCWCSTVAIGKCAATRVCPAKVPRVLRSVQSRFHAIFKNYTPLVESLSFKKVNLDITEKSPQPIPTAWETAKEIRARIYDETKLTASAGDEVQTSSSPDWHWDSSQTKRAQATSANHAPPGGSPRRDLAGGEVPRRRSKDGKRPVVPDRERKSIGLGDDFPGGPD